MFSKKPHSDVKKSSQKVLDSKKDCLGRLKHLRIVLENSDLSEAKTFFESNYSHIYYIFYDVFISAETNLKQRAHHRTAREDLELVRFIFEKLLILLPELINRRWQCHSLQKIMKKFLHYGNSVKLRRDGVRLFLLWYQILGENAPNELDSVFMSLVPGLIPGVSNPYIIPPSSNQSHGIFSRSSTTVESYQETSTFYASTTEVPESGPISPIEILPILPPLSGEQQPDDTTRFYLDCLLEYMVSQVCKVEWRDKSEFRYLKCFHFLFEKFKKHYLPHLFPGFSCISNLFSPSLDLPVLRHEIDIKVDHDNTRFSQKDTLYHCQSTVIRWVTHFTQCLKKATVTFQQPVLTEMKDQNETNRPSAAPTENEGNQSSSSLLSASSFGLERDPSSTSLGNDDLSLRDYTIVRSTLYSSRENINMVNEIFRRAFLMHFKYASTMRKVVAVYREWIHKNSNEKPVFLEEPIQTHESKEDKVDGPLFSKLHDSSDSNQDCQELPGMRLRKDSYIKAIHSDNNHLRAGLQNVLIVFLTNAANVFLLDLSYDSLHFLEEQVDMCKRVLNIYRYMVMNIQMERRVWEQLLLVLLQITSLVLKEVPPVKKEDVLGGRLAPALFQTLIVTWIKANLNVVISTGLWDKFLSVLSSLTLWEELIKEWAKTMETLTRVLAKQVYSLDLNDLPLDRLSEQKMKKNRGIRRTVIGNLDEKFEKCKSQSEAVCVDKSNFLAGNVYDDTSSRGTVRTDAPPVMRARSGSGDHIHKHLSGGMRRSISDSNLFRKNHSHRLKELAAIDLSSQKQVFITGEDEFSKSIPPFEECRDSKKMSSRQKSKSLDFLAHRADSPCFSESSECRSRSPSPTPSSGLESTSIKDSPMQIDAVVSSTDNSCNNSESFQAQKMDHFGILISKKEIGSVNHVEGRSIMSGGSTRGWLPDVAVVLWKRMLGALGDVNKIKDASVHAQVLKYLVDLSELFVKIRDNLGVTVDNLSTPAPPEHVPPLLLVTPWLFEALNLPEKYKQGKLIAFKLLCILMVRRHDIPLLNEYLAHFYYSLHYGLMANDQDMINTIVKYCGPSFFSIGLPGSTLLVMDFIYAADTVISSSDVKGVPRTEAISILGSLLSLTNVYKEIPTLQPSSTELFTIACKDAKDHIISILFKAGKREPAGLARCIAINSIGIYLYEELMNKTNHYRIKEAVTVLLIAVRSALSNSTNKFRNVEFNCKAVARVASDMLLLLCDHAEELQKMYSDLCRTVIEVLSSTLENLLPSADAILMEEDKKLILSLIHCIGEWCFVTKIGSPSISEQDFVPLLAVFKVLNAAASGRKLDAPQGTQSLTELSTPDVDPNVQVENFQEGTTPTPSVPPRTLQSPEKARSADSSFFKTIHNQDNNLVIRLAAKSLICHLINHLGHFPMGIGASRLTSLVNEHDDVPTLTGDELSAEVFHAPNVQFFIFNNTSIVSFVEIPALDMPGGGATAGLTTSKSQVRVIVRDLGGKFSWDSSILYGPPDFYFCYSDLDPFGAPLSLTVPQDFHTSRLNMSGLSNSPASQSLRHRPKDELPTTENSADDLDNLDDLLQYIGHTSPECVSNPVQALNAAPTIQNEEGRDREADIINQILNQRNQEFSQFEKYSLNSCMEAKGIQPPQPCEASSPFQHCRLLLNQLGFTSWERRSQFDLLKKNEQLVRELRNLDKQLCRDTHKIAVIYVAAGQEDKNSILLNPGASQEFEDFVAGLGWEVELESHLGFLGGLQRNRTTGDTAPYYATPFTEVIFHVSTRMSATIEPDTIHKKVCHLGNDEVHIVWSEHARDYRKEIIATEFCDVLIVIYPVGGKMYRIHISRKLGIPFFGPLFNGAIVGHKVLPGLVRATAINANRAKRSLMSLYMNYYEERNKSLEVILQNHKDQTTFEQFAASIYSPAPAKTAVTNRSSGPPSRTDSACSRGIPNLAAALLDAHSKGSAYSPSIRSRTVSQSTAEDISPHSSPQTSLRDRPLSASQSQT